MKPSDKSKRSNKNNNISKGPEYNVRSLDMYRTSDAYKKRKDMQNTDKKIDRKDSDSVKKSSYQKESSNQRKFSSEIKQKPFAKKRIKIKRPVYSKKTIALFLSMSVILVSAFSSVGFLMYRYSQVSDMKYEVNTLNNNLLQIKNQKKEIEVELETTNRSELIEQIAVDILKMQYPAEEKIVYIKVD